MCGVLVALVIAASGIGTGRHTDDRPLVVATTAPLGALVHELVGDAATVAVVIPNGADPHDYRPSAKGASLLHRADLIVANGRGLEAGLTGAMADARAAGVPVFTVADHLGAIDRPDDDDHAESPHPGENHDDPDHAGHDHADGDPHIWLDPLAMRAAMAALAPRLESSLGPGVAARAAALDARLSALDRRVRARLSSLDPAQRRIISGHESLGYFARRYDLSVVGVLIPSLSSEAHVSAANLAHLRRVVAQTGVSVIFNEAGTPKGVAATIADATGARVVDLATHTLPGNGSYETFIEGIADAIAAAAQRPARGATR